MTDKKAPARVVRFEDLDFVPRFEGGDQAQVAVICSHDDGSELGTGIVRMTKARLDWTTKYDEVVHVLSGHLKIHTSDAILEAGPKDSIWLPADTALTYEAEEALVLYAIHPSNWAEA